MQKKKPSGTPSAASSSSKQPEPLTVFLDESLDSDSISDALSATGITVERLTRHLRRGTPDADWLAYAGARGWVVLTRDKRVRYDDSNASRYMRQTYARSCLPAAM